MPLANTMYFPLMIYLLNNDNEPQAQNDFGVRREDLYEMSCLAQLCFTVCIRSRADPGGGRTRCDRSIGTLRGCLARHNVPSQELGVRRGRDTDVRQFRLH